MVRRRVNGVCGSALLLLSLAAAGAVATTPALTLAVGEVNETAARVMFACEYVPDGSPRVSVLPCPRTLQLRLFDGGKVVSEDTIRVERTPRVHTWRSLTPGARYSAKFVESSASTVPGRNEVAFRTLPAAGGAAARDWRFVVMSCNRYNEDSDGSFLQQLSERVFDSQPPAVNGGADPPVDATFHLGDQIYGDELKNLYRHALQSNGSIPLPSFEYLLNAYRAMYRMSWSEPNFRRLLTSGAHYMMPDDHDLFDNADAHYFENTNQSTSYRVVLEAGRRAYYEFQAQLRFDFDVAYPQDANAPETIAAYRALEVAGSRQARDHLYFGNRFSEKVGVIMLDTRFRRVFQSRSDKPELYGAEQLDFVKNQLASWSKSGVSSVLLFQAIPFLYVNTIASHVSYVVTNEKYSGHPDLFSETDRLLQILRPHSNRVTLFSGDIHHYVETDICHTATGACMRQVCTSGVTSKTSALSEWHVYGFFSLNAVTSRVMGEWTMTDGNSFLDNNAAIVHVTGSAAVDAAVRTEPVWRDDSTRTLRSILKQSAYPYPGFVFMISILLSIPIAVIVCVIGRIRYCCSPGRSKSHTA